jgi:hypothetical protein
MKKCDRALKLKGWHQVDTRTDGAVRTMSWLKDSNGNKTEMIERAWSK